MQSTYANDAAGAGLLDFYPTPPALVRRMVEGLSLHLMGSILEPSGGKGDICDYLRNHIYDEYDYRRKLVDIDVIEINPELQHVLRGKGFRLVHDDFLTFDTRKTYGAIIANFPFSEGDKHLEKALDMLHRSGGVLRCLVNAETIRNPHTRLRQHLVERLSRLNAEIEFLTGEFETAERKTSVEVALIKIEVERPEPISVLLDSMRKAEAAEVDDRPSSQIVETDFIAAIVARFNVECDAGIKLLNEFYGMRPYILDRLPDPNEERDYSSPLLKLQVEGRAAGNCLNADINNYLRGARSKYWQALVRDPRFTCQYTSNILKDLEAKLEELAEYDFSVFNIRELQKELAIKVTAGVEKAILDLFDTCSREFAYGDDFGNNVHYYNGWKTNKAHKINKKIILPIHGLRARWDHGSHLDYEMGDRLNDMVKVFNYLSRDKTDVPKLVGESIVRANETQDFNLDLQYFSIKLYKKGTAHITFKDLDLLDKFNIFGSQRKHWLPPSYGKKAYAEMTEEEKQVIDSFQGEAEYEKVMKQPEFFLVENVSQLLLESGQQQLSIG